MTARRTLTLHRETLTELTPADLAGVVGAGGIPTLDADCEATTLCITRGHITCEGCTP